MVTIQKPVCVHAFGGTGIPPLGIRSDGNMLAEEAVCMERQARFPGGLVRHMQGGWSVDGNGKGSMIAAVSCPAFTDEEMAVVRANNMSIRRADPDKIVGTYVTSRIVPNVFAPSAPDVCVEPDFMNRSHLRQLRQVIRSAREARFNLVIFDNASHYDKVEGFADLANQEQDIGIGCEAIPMNGLDDGNDKESEIAGISGIMENFDCAMAISRFIETRGNLHLRKPKEKSTCRMIWALSDHKIKRRGVAYPPAVNNPRDVRLAMEHGWTVASFDKDYDDMVLAVYAEVVRDLT